MASYAGPDNRIVVHASHRLPVRIRVTFLTKKIRRDVI